MCTTTKYASMNECRESKLKQSIYLFEDYKKLLAINKYALKYEILWWELLQAEVLMH